MKHNSQTKCNAVLAAGVAALLVTTGNSQAQSSDALIDKLVDKGILTVKEANDLREETDKGFNSAYAVKNGMPDWVTSFKINGDVRGRYEGFFFEKNSPAPDRNRFRYRLRVGGVATIKDNFEAGFRLTSSEATGSFGGDPISGNTTLTSNGSKKFVFIDLAYAKWTPINNSLWSATTTFGKMENPFVVSDMVFDADYTPEGIAQQMTVNISDKHVLKASAAVFALSEQGGSSNDSYLAGAQLRWDSTWTKKLSSSVGLGIFGFNNRTNLLGDGRINQASGTTAGRVPDQNTGNTRTVLPGSTLTVGLSSVSAISGNRAQGTAELLYAYTPFVADASATYTLETFPMYEGAFPIKFFGDYMRNPNAPTQNIAYDVGVMFGKSGKKGTWDVSYRWKHLERDAWYEEFTDSDYGAVIKYGKAKYNTATDVTTLGSQGYAAGTNIKGHVIKATYSPYDSMTIGLTYFLTELIQDDFLGAQKGGSKTGRLQVDASWKF